MNKTISLFEIVGLGFGMSMSILVISLIKSQFDYDNFHPFTERTYRITTEVVNKDGDKTHYATTPLSLRRKLEYDYRFTEDIVSIFPAVRASTNLKGETFVLKSCFTDQSFFKVFGFSLVNSSDPSGLQKPYTAVLSKEASLRLYGEKNPIGLTLETDQYGQFTITGILDKSPGNSRLNDFDVFFSFNSISALESKRAFVTDIWNWGAYDNSYTFILLGPVNNQSTSLKILENISKSLSKEYDLKDDIIYNFSLQRIDKTNPSSLKFELGRGGSVSFLWILSTVAMAILLMTTINYINIRIAQSLNRAKEITLRKISGAATQQLFLQILCETILKGFLACVLAIFIAELLPLTAKMSDSINTVRFDWKLALYFIMFSLLVGILAGLIPAMILCKLNPINTLNRFANGKILRKTFMGKPLIIIQFTFSIFFTTVLIGHYNQTLFMKNSDYGFNIKNLFRVGLRDANPNTMLNSLSPHSNVDKIFLSSESFGIGSAGKELKVTPQTDKEVVVDYFSIDHRLIPAIGIKIIAGSNFPENSNDNANYVILNELAVDVLRLGNPFDAIGKSIRLQDSLMLEVIGVVKNFNYRSFKFPIGPMAFLYRQEEFRFLNFKLKNGATTDFIEFVDNTWKKQTGYLPEMQNFEAYFNQRQSYQEDFIAIGSFSVMALLISFVGLFGVVIYTLQKHTKEIGIRKVFGGDPFQITFMLSKIFIKPLLIATVLGTSIGINMHSIINKEFVYKAPFNPLLLFASIFCITFIALSLIMYNTFKAASINPIKTLSAE